MSSTQRAGRAARVPVYALTYHSLTAPQRRLSMADALRHPFFDDVDKVNVGTVPLEGMGSEVAEAQ